MYIHTRTYNEFLVIYIGSFDTPSTKPTKLLSGGAAVSAVPTKPTKLLSGGAAVSAAPTKQTVHILPQMLTDATPKTSM